VHDDQLVDKARGQRPQRVFAQYRNIWLTRGPRHNALRSGHQSDHPPRLSQIGPQQRHGKTKACDRLALCLWPHSHQFIAYDLLRRPAKGAAVVKITQLKYVQMHYKVWGPKAVLRATLAKKSEFAMPVELITVPCLNDNYAFLIHDALTGQTALIDAPEAAPIRAALDARGWTLTDILITHHHDDHIQALAPLRGTARVIGAKADAHRLPPLDLQVAGGDTFTVCGCKADVIEVYGHTVGHIAFHIPSEQLLFTADSLMAMGCGRLFEGTPAQMWDSVQRLRALPGDTVVCSGHEYTATNAQFALSLEPGNSAIISRVMATRAARENGLATVPSPLWLECETNPFLRADDPALAKAMNMADAQPDDIFTEIRARRDRF
jgi:hydroxyacylglutathione hydrolase